MTPNRLKLTVFFPLTQQEEEHIKDLVKVINLKRNGDYKLISELTNIGVGMVKKYLIRIESEKHMIVFNALKEIVNSRKMLFNKNK